MKLAVVHYMPLEFYPPITNFLNEVSKTHLAVKIWSTYNNRKRTPYENAHLQQIKRTDFPTETDNTIMRFVKYIKFNWSCFLGLIHFRPDSILYYESYSVFPVFLYMKLFGKQTRLYIHYHEYESPKNYAQGMRLVRFYHQSEKRYLYNKAIWISQTNSDRLRLFKIDNPKLCSSKLKVMPNYPPASWWQKTKQRKSNISDPIKTVYVGALSLRDTYIKDYCEWLQQQDGGITLDIYAYNLHQDTKDYLENLKSSHVKFHAHGVAYEKLPNVLQEYDIGLILYKGNTLNYIYNAPNKLFEYLACGLKVLYPKVMTGIKPYVVNDVMAVDYNVMTSLNIYKEWLGKEHVTKITYTSEMAYNDLIVSLIAAK